VPLEFIEGWELFTAIHGGIVQKLTWREWNMLPDNQVWQLMVLLEIVPQVMEAKRVTKAEK